MKLHVFQDTLVMPLARAEMFAFFSKAENLEAVTPPWLRFRIVTPGPIELGVDARITYRLRVHGVPVRWRTRISRWEPPLLFEDTQERGPYRTWIHLHTFEETPDGTRMTDTVRYRGPGGPLEPLIDRLFVRRDVAKIFAYRKQKFMECFQRGEGHGALS